MTSCLRIYLPKLCGVLQFICGQFSYPFPASCYWFFSHLGHWERTPSFVIHSLSSAWQGTEPVGQGLLPLPHPVGPALGPSHAAERAAQKRPTHSLQAQHRRGVCLSVHSGKFSLNASELKSMVSCLERLRVRIELWAVFCPHGRGVPAFLGGLAMGSWLR